MKGRTRTNSGEVFSSNLGRPTNSASSGRRAPPSTLWLAFVPSPAPASPPLPPLTAGDPLGQQQSTVLVEENEEKKEGKKEEKERAHAVGEERRWKNCISLPLSPQTSNKPLTLLQPSPYFLSATQNNSEEPETKLPETHKHQHTTNNRE